MKFSVVIPFYNEEGNVIPVVEEIITVMKKSFSIKNIELMKGEKILM